MKKDDQAIEWHVHLHGLDNSVDNSRDAAEFDRWLNADPDNRSEFEQLRDCWNTSKGLNDSKAVANIRMNIEQLKGLAEKEARLGNSLSISGSMFNFQFLSHYKGLLASAFTMLLGVALCWSLTIGGQSEAVRYHTKLGERRVVELQDGSKLMLNTKSTVDVLFTERLRSVSLLRGQVSFDVAHDKSKPFKVTVGGSTVTALGTSFDIFKSEYKTLVTLLEGSVEVSKPIGGGDAAGEPTPVQRIRLLPGEQIHYSETTPLSETRTVDPNSVSAWKSGRMSFQSATLALAIQEANRYSDIELKLADHGIESLPISGIFQVGDNEAFARTLAVFHGLKMKRPGRKKIVLYR